MALRRVLICGATGFIGRNVVERLADRDDLELVGIHNRRPPFSHRRVRWIQGDLTCPNDVSRCIKDVDIVIQAAATTTGVKDIVARPQIHITDNAVMNSLVFRAAHESGVKHVLFFSCTVMYPSSDVALDEGAFDANKDPHPRYFGIAWTKVYVEKMCEFYSRLGRTKFTAIRHSNIYGPHDKFDLEHSHVCGATITKVLSAVGDSVGVWGTGDEARDLLFVDDLVEFVALAMDRQNAPYALYNVGLGRATSVSRLAHEIIRISGRPLGVKHDLSKPTIPTSLVLDCAKAYRELGWKPRVDLEDGLSRTIDWWRKNRPHLSPHLA